jgi:hypothetical protein
LTLLGMELGTDWAAVVSPLNRLALNHVMSSRKHLDRLVRAGRIALRVSKDVLPALDRPNLRETPC